MILYVFLLLFTLANSMNLACPKANGYFPIENSFCKSYFECRNWKLVTENTCPEGQNFNPYDQWCDWEDLYPCMEATTSPVCQSKSGLFPKPGSECKFFYECINGIPYERHCYDDQLYNHEIQSCEWPELYSCKDDGVERSTTVTENPVTSVTQRTKISEFTTILSTKDTADETTNIEDIWNSTSDESTSGYRSTSPVSNATSMQTSSRSDPTDNDKTSTLLTSTDLRTRSPQTRPYDMTSEFPSASDVGSITSDISRNTPRRQTTGPGDLVCPSPTGIFPHPTNKHKFIGCVDNILNILDCPENLIYDEYLVACIWP